MRVVKFCMPILCATLLCSFALQPVQTQAYTQAAPYGVMTHPGLKPVPNDSAPPPPPTHYTSPNGIMRHHAPQQEVIYTQQPEFFDHSQGMEMHQPEVIDQSRQYQQPKSMKKKQRRTSQQSLQHNTSIESTPTVSASPVLAKVDSANITPQTRARVYQTLAQFSAENDPLYTELLRLKQQRLEMDRSAFKNNTPTDRASLEHRRKNLRRVLMGKLKRQQQILKAEYGIKVSSRDLLMHRLYLMNTNQQPGSYSMGSSQTVHTGHSMATTQDTMDQGYRNPQEMNPDYNQQYLRQKTMREAYQGQTYEQ